MNFVEAIKAVTEGKAVTRLDWQGTPGVHVAMALQGHPEPVISIFNGVKGGDRYHDWIISKSDIEADDWELTAIAPKLPMAGGGLVPRGSRAGVLKPHGGTLISNPKSSPVPKPRDPEETNE